ncbi:GPR1/FUN34/YaaH family transporter [soil metagenome]
MPESNVIEIKDTTSNPAPLGLLAFGMTTVLLNIHNAGFYPLDSMILAMGIFYGGIAQVIAGLLEWKKNNTFGTTAFLSYGFFWLSLVGLILLPKIFPGATGVNPANDTSMAAYLAMWGLFTGVMFIATLRISYALQFIFLTLTILFFMLAIGDFTGNKALKTAAGFEGIICGASAMYTGLALVINEVFAHPHLPIGHVKKK